MIHPVPTLRFRTSGSILLTALIALGTAACQNTSSAPEPASEPASQAGAHAELSNELTATAAVVSVDKAQRLITLRDQDGSMFTVLAGPAVRNFDQIAAGDELRVHYHESLTATLRPAGETAAPVEGAFVAGRAKPGEKPAAGAGLAASVRVKIESIDHTNDIVVFSLSGGELRTIRAARTEGREFIKKLKVGDIVQIDYAASMALTIEKL